MRMMRVSVGQSRNAHGISGPGAGTEVDMVAGSEVVRFRDGCVSLMVCRVLA